MKVKCIVSHCSALIEGKVYSVEDEDRYDFLIHDEDDENYWYSKDNFEIIDEVESMTKEELLKRKQDLEDEIMVAKDRLETVCRLIEEEAKKKMPWKPAMGQEYYFIQKDGEIREYEFVDDVTDNRLLNAQNIFKTEEEAEEEFANTKLLRALAKFAKANNEEEIDWSNTCSSKYYISFDCDTQEYEILATEDYKDLGLVYFSSYETAQKAIDEFREELDRFYADVRS